MKSVYTPGESKEHIRNYAFNFFRGSCTHVITLPNLYFGLESRLLAEGIKVDCSEYRVNTFEGAIQVKPEGINLYHSDVKNLNLSPYDGLFFDLYGTWNKSVQQSLPRINRNARLVITFLMGRETRELQKVIDIKNREKSYVKLLNEYGFSVIKYINYRDTTPMCVFFCIKDL